MDNNMIQLAVGRSRKDISWKNVSMTWAEFTERLKEPHRTHETADEYKAMPPSRRDELKDVGGFVGAVLSGGRRTKESVLFRTLITLDIDFANPFIWDNYIMLFGNAAALYSTHSHIAAAPRYRLVIPLSRDLTKDEYEPCARMLASDLDINTFDDSTFEYSRLMYWPSASKDAEYIFKVCEGGFLNPDDILKRYEKMGGSWRDTSFWPQSDRVQKIISNDIKKQGEPAEKPGLIGAFCREYTITEAIEAFLSDSYASTVQANRYTYIHGSTASGLIVYDDKFAYSHHGTDPAGGRLCNAFDLVRIHKFGLSDEDANEDCPANKLPSYVKMCEFVSNDEKVTKRLVSEKLSQAKSDFEFVDAEEAPAAEEHSTEWYSLLKADKKGNIESTINNVAVILENDYRMKERIGYNEFEHREVMLKSLPWRKYIKGEADLRDADDANFRLFFESEYGITGQKKIEDGVCVTVAKHSFHPVKEYLNGLSWDGAPRIETLVIDYLGAKDTKLNRAVTRKAFVAAVARIYEPGCKFDYVLTLIGSQGLGKSTLIRKMGRNWFSDSLDEVVGKDAYEQLQGVWLVELGELATLKKAEVEQIKHFISKVEDRYRVAYGRRTQNFPRQCVFFGTTNNREFLKDSTGNRRFWPIDIGAAEPTKNIFTNLTDYEIGQMWAECVELYRCGEDLFLTSEMEKLIAGVQEIHSEQDDRKGLIEEYLEIELPECWNKLSIFERQNYISDGSYRDNILSNGQSTAKREKVCVAEIWSELFKGDPKTMNTFNTKDLHSIMKKLDSWDEYAGSSKLRFGGYGLQKAYVRSK